MRHWSLAELQNRHDQIVRKYIQKVSDLIVACVKNEKSLSPYVVKLEEYEQTKISSLVIKDCQHNVLNPFHGKLDSSKTNVVVYAEKKSTDQSLGIDIHFQVIDGVFGFLITSIKLNSAFANTDLHVGMFLHTVGGSTFDNIKAGINLFRNLPVGWFHVIAKTLPLTSSVYTIAHEKGT